MLSTPAHGVSFMPRWPRTATVSASAPRAWLPVVPSAAPLLPAPALQSARRWTAHSPSRGRNVCIIIFAATTGSMSTSSIAPSPSYCWAVLWRRRTGPLADLCGPVLVGMAATSGVAGLVADVRLTWAAAPCGVALASSPAAAVPAWGAPPCLACVILLAVLVLLALALLASSAASPVLGPGLVVLARWLAVRFVPVRAVALVVALAAAVCWAEEEEEEHGQMDERKVSRLKESLQRKEGGHGGACKVITG